VVLETKIKIFLFFVSLFITPTLAQAQTSENPWYNKAIELKNQLEHYASDTIKPKDLWNKSYEKLHQIKVPDSLTKTLDQISNYLDSKKDKNKKQNIEEQRRFIEFLGKQKLASDSKSLNELAQETISKHFPSLQHTDFFNNPSKAISFYLVLDVTGFIDNVKIVKGPLGVPMTMREAYEYYTRTDPEKAKKMLKMIKHLQNISNKDISCSDKLKNIIDAFNTNLQLFNSPKR